MKKIVFTILLIVGLTSCTQPAPAAPPAATATISVSAPVRSASIKEIENNVQARGANAKDFQAAHIGLLLTVGGQAQTGNKSKARIDFIEGTIVRLGENTNLTVEELTLENGSPLTRFQMELGKLWIALKGGNFDVKTPGGIVSVRGSYAILEVFPDGRVRFILLEGRGAYSNNIPLNNMQGVVIDKNQFTRFEVPTSFVVDFCDNNIETCPVLLQLLNIKSLDSFKESKDRPDTSKQSPKEPPPLPVLR